MFRPKFLFPLLLLVGAGLVALGPLLRKPAPLQAGETSVRAHETAQPATKPRALLPTVATAPQSGPPTGPLVENDPPKEFPGARILQEVIDPKPNGSFERRRLLSVEGPYPLVRTVEHYAVTSGAGFRRETIEAMLRIASS